MSNSISSDIDMSEILYRILEDENASCAVYSNDTFFIHYEKGVKPIVDFWSLDLLKDAVVADRVIGKASAMFAIAGGAKYVRGGIVSQLAEEILDEYNVPFSTEKTVPKILSRDGKGLCPMESSVNDCENIENGTKRILEKMKEMGLLEK